MFLKLFLPYPGIDPTKPFYPITSWQEFVLQQPDWFPRSFREPLIAQTVPYALSQLHVSSILFSLHDHWRIYWLFRNVGNQLYCVWNVMAHAQKPDFVFWRGLQFSRLPAAEVCASAVVMLDTTYSEVGWRGLATHSIRQFPLHFPYRASPCAITFQLGCINNAVQHPGRAKASTFQAFINCKASSLDAMRRKINYFNNI